MTAHATDLPKTPGPTGSKLTAGQARSWATGVHLAALIGLLGNGVGFLLGPLVVWLIKRNDDALIDAEGKKAVNFQLTVFCAMIVAVPLVFLMAWILSLVGGGEWATLFSILLGLVVIGGMAIVLPIVAAVKVSRGESFDYPLAIPFLR